MPVLSAMKTRRDVICESQVGSARKGLAAMLSSSSTEQEARIGGRAGRRQQEISSARSVVEIGGREEDRKEGIWFGVEELESSKWVVPRIIRSSIHRIEGEGNQECQKGRFLTNFDSGKHKGGSTSS